MKIIQPSHELWYPSEPLKDIERAARISYASEGKTTETSAKPLVDKLFSRGHMTPFEFVTFAFKIRTNKLRDSLLYINQISNVQGDLMISNSHAFAYATCNLRTLINITKFDTKLAAQVLTYFPELEVYFNESVYEITNDVEVISEDDCPIKLQYQTVKFITNRGVTHELVRHRKAGFVQSSTRYIGYDGEQFDGELPIVMNRGFVNATDSITEEYEYFIESSQNEYNHYRELGMSPGEARAILPNDTMSEIVMIARHWSWEHFFKLRTASGAHPDMRALIIPCYNEFKSKWPE